MTVVEAQGLVLESSKGFFMASSEQGAKALAAGLQGIGGQRAVSIKRLGIDHWWGRQYSGKNKGRGQGKAVLGPVMRARTISGRKRSSRLVSLRKWTGASGAKLFTGGILPHSTYGAEMAAFPACELASLRSQWIAAAGHKPVGTPRALQALVLGTHRDPYLIVVTRPLIRWAREVWIVTTETKEAGDRSDILRSSEIWQAWKVLEMVEAKNEWISQGPLRGLQAALRFLGWRYPEPYVLADHHGTLLHMDEMTPALLWKLIVRAQRYKTANELDGQLRTRGLLPNDKQVHWQMVVRAVRQLKGREVSLLLQLIWGTLPTNWWLAQHGWATAPTCECGAVDTVHHRTACVRHVWQGPAVTPEQLASVAWKTLPPGKKEVPMGLQCWDGGLEVDPEGFEFDPGTIYTDGSAPGTGWDELEECGAAAIQLEGRAADGNGRSLKVVRMRIGALPPSAVMAEHVAILLAQRFGSANTTVVADCSAVVTGFLAWQQGQDQALSYRNPHGGLWKQMAQLTKEREIPAIVHKVLKVTAHKTREQLAQLGEDQWHQGNEKADVEAGHAAGAVEAVDRIRYSKELDGRVQRLRSIARSLHGQQWTDFQKLGKAYTIKGRRARQGGQPHMLAWDSVVKRWGCQMCGRHAVGAKGDAVRKLCKASCTQHDLLEGVGSGHQIRFGWLDGRFSIAVCLRCGRWRSSRGRGLLHT